MVESIFRSMKSLLRTRPIYHKCDDTIRGHVFCSFLAVMLRKRLQDRLEEVIEDPEEAPLEWADIIRELDNLAETELQVGGKNYKIRTEAKGTVAKVFKACGVALPPVLRQCDPT
jgi:transposase